MTNSLILAKIFQMLKILVRLTDGFIQFIIRGSLKINLVKMVNPQTAKKISNSMNNNKQFKICQLLSILQLPLYILRNMSFNNSDRSSFEVAIEDSLESKVEDIQEQFSQLVQADYECSILSDKCIVPHALRKQLQEVRQSLKHSIEKQSDLLVSQEEIDNQINSLKNEIEAQQKVAEELEVIRSQLEVSKKIEEVESMANRAARHQGNIEVAIDLTKINDNKQNYHQSNDSMMTLLKQEKEMQIQKIADLQSGIHVLTADVLVNNVELDMQARLEKERINHKLRDDHIATLISSISKFKTYVQKNKEFW